MNVYLKAILILSVISGVVSSFISDMSSSMKKYVNYLIGLIMVIVIILPFKNVADNLLNIKDYIKEFTSSIKTEQIIDESNSVIINSSEENICKGIKNAVISKFGFEDNDVFVSITMDKSEISAIKITAVNIILTNHASWSNVDEVKSYMENLVGVKVNVTRK